MISSKKKGSILKLAASSRVEEHDGEASSSPSGVAVRDPIRIVGFTVPAEHDGAYLYVYFNGPPGSALWLDDARTSTGPPDAPVPPDWCPRFLAHELPRALLQAGAGD